MSIRQYRPRGRSRRGMTSRQAWILYTLFALTVGLQILYPLIHGGLLRFTTIAIVYCASLTMLAHALFSYGAKYLSLYLVITFSFSLLIEEIGSRTGWPFGEYHYSTTLGFQFFGVPLVDDGSSHFDSRSQAFSCMDFSHWWLWVDDMGSLC